MSHWPVCSLTTNTWSMGSAIKRMFPLDYRGYHSQTSNTAWINSKHYKKICIWHYGCWEVQSPVEIHSIQQNRECNLGETNFALTAIIPGDSKNIVSKTALTSDYNLTTLIISWWRYGWRRRCFHSKMTACWLLRRSGIFSQLSYTKVQYRLRQRSFLLPAVWPTLTYSTSYTFHRFQRSQG